MPRREDIESILVIGSGPIVIGQACEFDYSGAQACRVLRAEGYRVVLANSNPATIMTDPELADATYVEPLDAQSLTRVVERERPDAVLATLGGQTGLNLAMELWESGALAESGAELIGADAEAIAVAENRELFKRAMIGAGLEVPRSGTARSADEARAVAGSVGLPVIIRPAFILGGRGAAMAATDEELVRCAEAGLAASPIGEILIEESIAGWKEYELEVMRDQRDNCVVVCSIENLDPMGVHTGDSITVAPAQTLTDVEYQRLRDAAFAVLRRVGVATGGSNVQFAVDPGAGRQVVIEMNPRVSRSSALASKATGFPIAKMAAKLAVGYTLDEIPNDITGKTPACFEPAIDYVVTKIPRWAFEKFPGAGGVLGPSMQSVGEAMAIGRTFPESLQKGLRSLETGRLGLNADPAEAALDRLGDGDLRARAARPHPDRLFCVEALLRRGETVEALASATGIDGWFLDQMALIAEERARLEWSSPEGLDRAGWRRAKRLGFSDGQLAWLWGRTEAEVRRARLAAGVRPTFKTVDTCAAEFEADTPYHYSAYEDADEVAAGERRRVVILGSGPNRIGQGIEFDYCCVHASLALRDAGYETVMVNCNPETVSTDYDTSDRLYFEPLTFEDVSNVIEAEAPVGVIVALGGQTPLGLAGRLPPELVMGTSPESIDRAEDRQRWNGLCARLGIPQPPGGAAADLEGARAVTARIGYPALVRPSYVLGGRAMEIVYDDDGLAEAMGALASSGALASAGDPAAEHPVLVDRFLEDAVEVDVDAVRDGAGEVLIGAVMEHVEQAGVHSGDSACSIPPATLSGETVAVIEGHTRRIAEALGVKGLLNVQYAVQDGTVYVLEANPRASRTVPFAAKATGVPLAKAAARVMAGATLAELRAEGMIGRRPASGQRPAGERSAEAGASGRDDGSGSAGYVAVKEAVLPFNRFPETDAVLGPEMRSTGEVMGIDLTAGLAFVKAQAAAGARLPDDGAVFMSMADRDKPLVPEIGRILAGLGYEIAATAGTAARLRSCGVEVATAVAKIGTGEPGRHAVDLIEAGEVGLVVNTPSGRGPRADGEHIRAAAGRAGIPLFTTGAAALAAARGLRDLRHHQPAVRSLQEYHRLGQDRDPTGAGADRDRDPAGVPMRAAGRNGPGSGRGR